MKTGKLLGISLLFGFGALACAESSPADDRSNSQGGSSNSAGAGAGAQGGVMEAGVPPDGRVGLPDATLECAPHDFDASIVDSTGAPNGIWVNDPGARHVISLGDALLHDEAPSRGVWIIGAGNDPEVYYLLEVGGTSFVTAVNSPTNNEFPCRYTRLDYILELESDAGSDDASLDASADPGSGRTLRVCETTHSAESALEAWNTKTADRDDLIGGCNGGPWELLEKSSE
jgi:hypothetical protein